MQKKYFYNSIISFTLIVSTILMPISFIPQKAEAQIRTSNSAATAGMITGIVAEGASLPQCQKVISEGIGGVKSLFSGIGDLFSGSPIDSNNNYAGPDPSNILPGGIGGGDSGNTIFSYSGNNYLNNVGGSNDGGFGLDNIPTIGLDMSQGGITSSDLSSFKGLSDSELSSMDSSLNSTVNSATNTATTPAVNNATGNKLQGQTNKILTKLEKETADMDANSSCLQSMGRLMIKKLLQKLTISTVAWINSGFNGSPSFIQDPSKFFGDMAKNEILKFGGEINNPTYYPFGKAWLKNTAMAFNNKFADNARYSLDQEIRDSDPTSSAITFQTDFSQGGWDAWTALTQNPANNPLGFKLMADNELQTRLVGTNESAAQLTHDALAQANGFLSDTRCVVPDGITKQENDAAVAERSTNPKGPYKHTLCDRWEIVTPGKAVSDAVTNVMGYQNNAYLNVTDLNDSIAAITDALLSQFSNKIMEEGFANIGTTGADGTLYSSGTLGMGVTTTQTEKDFMPSQLSSSWLTANPDFNIRTDLTQALIDDQRTYSDKLEQQNKELNSTTDGAAYRINACPTGFTGTYPNCKEIQPTATINVPGGTINIPLPWNPCPLGYSGTAPNCIGPTNEEPGTTNAYGLIPTINQLDYCIPGPHPGWEEDAKKTLSDRLSSITPTEQKTNKAGDIANGIVGAGLNFVPYVGPLLSGVFGALTSDNDVIDRDTGARCTNIVTFASLTGFSFQCIRGIASKQYDINMLTQEGLFYVLNAVLDKYISIMDKTYFSSPDILPSVATEAATDFNQLPGYYQMIKDNNSKILSLKTTINILGDIKDAVDNLNAQLASGEITNDAYESSLKDQINAFGRVSADMVNGDDIATADNLLKQIIDKKTYIYNNLLKGPYGCEVDLEKPQKSFPSAGTGVIKTNWDWNNFNVNSVERIPYPLEILYDYDDFAKGTNIPDPLSYNPKCTQTDTTGACNIIPKTPDLKIPGAALQDLPPGFLSFVFFGTTYANGNDNTYNGAERLNMGGLIYDYDSGSHVYDWVPLSQKFEQTIGIY